jgi:hypothetical protein
MTNKLLITCIVLVLVLAGLLVYNISYPQTHPAMLVSFLSSTNDAAGVRYTTLILSNAGPQSIYRNCSYSITGPSGQARDTIKHAELGNGYLDRILLPGESETISIPTPVGEKAWRARFDCWTYPGKARGMAEDLLMIGRRSLGLKMQDVHSWGAGVSEIITE